MKLFNKLKKQTNVETKSYSIDAPIKGIVIDIKETNDPLFSEEALGKGVGIIADGNTIVAPISGTISTFFPTKHAIGITSETGVNVLIHVGIDTVELNGKYFEALKKQGDQINRGDELLKIDFGKIEESGYDATVLMVVTNTNDYSEINLSLGKKETLDIVIDIHE